MTQVGLKTKVLQVLQDPGVGIVHEKAHLYDSETDFPCKKKKTVRGVKQLGVQKKEALAALNMHKTF